MPKNSKGQKNGLTFYIINELIPELQRKGERYPKGFRDLVPIAIPLYQSLPPEQKARFESMAKMEKLKQREATAQKTREDLRDNLGNLVADRVDLKEKMKTKRQRDRNELQASLNTLVNSGVCNKDEPCNHIDLLEEKFYFVGFQYMICTEDQVYYPLEYGLVEWSMAKGISNAIHGFVNPGDIPLGYRFSAQAHSEDSHRIPLEEFPNGESDYQRVWIAFERFLKLDSYTSPILYCMEADYNVVTGCLSALHYHSGMANHFRVGILEELALALFLHRGFTISETSLFDMLTTSAYDFEANTKCTKHDEVEARHCAIGLPKKYTYALSDALSDLYGFTLTKDHLPTALPSCSPAVLTQDNCLLIPQESAGRGCRKTTIEPQSFTPKSTEGFKSQIGFPNPRVDTRKSRVNNDFGDEDGGDAFRPLQNCNPGDGPTNARVPLRFANTSMKAPSAASLPNPSPALLQPVKSSFPNSSWTMDAEKQFQNLVVHDVAAGDRSVQPSVQLPSPCLALDGVSNSFRSSGSSPVQRSETATSPASSLTASSIAYQPTVAAPQNVPTAPFVGRGRGFSGDLLMKTPGRMAMMSAPGSGMAATTFSPAGRGRAYVSAVDMRNRVVHPPPGFSSLGGPFDK